MALNPESSLIKINTPLSQNTLLRDRLSRQMDMAMVRSLLFISAPGGSGKTTLVSSYIQTKDRPCLWYQIDGGDADPATFFHYFGLAAANAVGKGGIDLPTFKPEQSAGFREFSRLFFSKIYASLPPDSVVVLDDLQEGGGAQTLEGVILAALDRIPKGVTLVMMSRSSPPPAFSRIFANGLGSQLGWEALRFTAEEFRAILEMRGCRMSGASADRIHEVMDGWIAGLHLLTEVSFDDAFEWDGDDSPQAVFDYFSHEVFNQLDQQLQTFLLKTAFLSPLSIPMAQAISHNPKAPFILQELHRHSHFTHKENRGDVVYHYHPLFRDFLQQQALERMTPEEIQHLRATAANLLLEAERFDEAVTCLRRSEDWERLTETILRTASILVTQGRHQTLLTWIGYLPDSLSQQDPWLLFWSGMCQLYLDPRKSQILYEKAYDRFEEQGHVIGMLQSCACLTDSITCIYSKLIRLDRWVGQIDRLWGQGTDFGDDSLEVDVIHAVLSVACFRLNDHPKIPTWEKRAKEIFAQIEEADQKMKLGLRLMMIATIRGNFSEVGALIVDCADLIRPLSEIGPLQRLRFFFNKSLYELLNGDLSACVATVTQALDFSHTSGIRTMDRFSCWTGALAAIGMGDRGLVERFRKESEDLGPPRNESEKAATVFIESYWAMLQGSSALALNMAERCLPLAKSSGFFWFEALGRICLGQLLCQTGDRSRGHRLLQEAHAAGEIMGSKHIAFTALIYCAAYEVSIPKAYSGDDLLRQALSLGKAEGYYNLPWFQPAVVSEVFARALMAGIEVDYVQAFIRQRKAMLGAPPTAVENWPWPLRIYTLGEFKVVIEDHPLRFTGRAQQKPLELLKALIALGGREVSVAKICDTLWPEASGDKQHQTFSTTLHRLRKLLGIKPALVLIDGNLSLDERRCWVDAWAFESLIDEAEKRAAVGTFSPETVHLRERALSLYGGRFLDNVDSFWTLDARERCRRRYLGAVEALGQHHEDAQRFSKAVAACQTALEIHPTVERLYQRIIRCYRQMGDRTEAMTTYKRCQAVLAELVDIQPSEETVNLYRSVAESRV